MRISKSFLQKTNKYLKGELEKPLQNLTNMPKTNEQYQAEKFSQIDQNLNLNTHIFELEKNERRINFNYIEGKNPNKKTSTSQLLNYLSSKIFGRKGSLLALTRGSNKLLKEQKIDAKPNIRREKLSASEPPNFDYLCISDSNHEEIQNFLSAEKNYLNLHFLSEGKNKQRLTKNWFKVYFDFHLDYPFFCDKSCYELSKKGPFKLTKKEFFNTGSLIEFSSATSETILDSGQIAEYLLGFKDDFSYFACRFVKNNSVASEMVEGVRISPDERFLALSLNFDGRRLTIIMDIKSKSFLKFYFNTQIEFFSFSKVNEFTSVLLFKETEAAEIKGVLLSSDLFLSPKNVPGFIHSVTRFMRANQNDLEINSVRGVIEDCKSLLAVEDGYKSEAFQFGTNVILKLSGFLSEDENSYYYYFHQGEFIYLGVK